MNAEVLPAPPQEKHAEKPVEIKLSPIEQKNLTVAINNFRVSPPVPEKSEKSEGSGTSEESEKPETSVESDTLGTSEESEIPGEPKEESKQETSEKSEKKRSFKIPRLLRITGVKSVEQVTSFNGSQKVRVFLPGEARCVQGSLVGITKEVGQDGEVHFSSKDPFTEFVLQNLHISTKALETLARYCSEGGRLVLLRSEKPTREFREALSLHAEEHNGGISALTQASVLSDGLAIEETPPSSDKEETPPESKEKKSLRNLVNLANNGRSIHFSAITPCEDKIFGNEVQDALLEVNGLLKPLEFVYWTTSSASETQRQSQIATLKLLGLSLVIPSFLQNIIAPLGGKIAEMLAASFGGDVIAGIMAGKGIERRNASVYQLLESIAHIREQVKTNKFLRHRLLAAASVFGITTSAVMLTVLSKGIMPFLMASPVNYVAIMLTELRKRTKTIPKTPEETGRLLHAMGKRHPLTEFLAQKFPRHTNLLLAWNDLLRNRTSIGELIGSIASVPLLLLLIASFPTVQLSTLVVLSTLTLEKVGGVVAGGGVLFRDPWKAFLKELPTVQALSDGGKMNVPAQE